MTRFRGSVDWRLFGQCWTGENPGLGRKIEPRSQEKMLKSARIQKLPKILEARVIASQGKWRLNPEQTLE